MRWNGAERVSCVECRSALGGLWGIQPHELEAVAGNRPRPHKLDLGTETLDILIPFVFVALTFIGLCFVIHSRRTGDMRYR